MTSFKAALYGPMPESRSERWICQSPGAPCLVELLIDRETIHIHDLAAETGG